MTRIIAIFLLPVLMLGLFACTGNVSGLPVSGSIPMTAVQESAAETADEFANRVVSLALEGRSSEAIELLEGSEEQFPEPESAPGELRALASVTQLADMAAPEDTGRTVVEVNSSRELIAALASDTEIHIAEGAYDLSGLGFALSLDNLALVGSGEVRILSGYGGESVFYFANCSNLTLCNITFGYDIPLSEVSSDGTLTFEGGSGISLIACNISGMNGIYCTADSISLSHCTISDCGGSAVLLQDTEASFVNCLFIGNGHSDGAQALFSVQSSAAELSGCAYIGNSCSEKYSSWDWNPSSRSSFNEQDCSDKGNLW